MSRRVISVLLAILCVLGSGAVLKMAEDNPWQEYDLVTADLDEWVELDDGVAMRVTHVTLGRDITKRDEVVGVSSARFMMVEGEIRATKEQVSGFKFEVHSGGRTYKKIDDNGMITPPGFISGYAAVFELPMETLTDLEIVMEDVEFISGYTRQLRLRPQITPQDIASSEHQKVELPTSELQVIT